MKKTLPKRWNEISLMFQFQRARHSTVQAALTREGLQDVGQPRILFLLEEEGADGTIPAQQELAEKLRVSPATIAASLKSLERMGYITRENDPADGRKKRIAITEKGRNARARCTAIFDEVDDQLFAGFADEELDRLRQYYCRMLKNLSAIGGQEDCCIPPPPFAGKEGNH